MIYIILTNGTDFGWGICGRYLTKEIAKQQPVTYISRTLHIDDIDDELEFHFLKKIFVQEPLRSQLQSGQIQTVSGPILQGIDNQTFEPWLVRMKGTQNVGYTFFENNALSSTQLKNASTYYDLIITGSSWCEKTLRDHQISNVKTVLQGIDPRFFNSQFSEKELFKDLFVIFSGGKFEFRKGQDIVIKAYKVLQDRHSDVMLVNNWYNPWPEHLQSMEQSPIISFQYENSEYQTLINKCLTQVGIDLDRVITLYPKKQGILSKIYQNTDIGLFPNRCEGGTNLVLMEYMACGKPVIASNLCGHQDILTEHNAIRIQSTSETRPIYENNTLVAQWDTPDLEETIEHLEWAYQNRDALKPIQTQAAEDLKQLTWTRSAEQFLSVLEKDL